MRRIIGWVVGFIAVGQCFGFSCYVTLAKDNCWTQYDVTVNVVDASGDKILATIDIPKGQSWGRAPFTCQPNQELKFRAVYSPVFWDSQKGVVYHEKQYLTLPSTIVKSKEVAWNIPVCFAQAFAEIPLPPDAKGNCQCDFTAIPPVKP